MNRALFPFINYIDPFTYLFLLVYVIMKKLVSIIAVIVLPIIMSQSCACSPESYARQDVKALDKAYQKNNEKAIERASEKAEKHRAKYKDDMDKYFRYESAFKDELKK